MNVLVDTSVWSLSVRRPAEKLNEEERVAVEELRELIGEGRAQLIGLIRQELLSGIRNEAQFRKLRQVLRAFSDQQLETSDYEAAAAAGNRCRSQGIAASAVDMLICAVALERQWRIFSLDPDFRRYAETLKVQLHEVRR